jgi:hypothetical protein
MTSCTKGLVLFTYEAKVHLEKVLGTLERPTVVGLLLYYLIFFKEFIRQISEHTKKKFKPNYNNQGATKA